jgi:hypothetical protein
MATLSIPLRVAFQNGLYLTFYGPHQWFDVGLITSIFYSDFANKSGIYIWTIPTDELGELVFYVGETEHFSKRFKEHFMCYLSGIYEVYDLEEIKKGKRIKIWQGLRQFEDHHNLKIFFDKQPEIFKTIREFMLMHRFYIDMPPLLVPV